MIIRDCITQTIKSVSFNHMLMNDRRVTIQHIAETMGIGAGSAYILWVSENISVLISSLEISNPLHYTGIKRKIFLSKGLTDRQISCVHWFLDVRLFDIAYGIWFYLFFES